MTLIITFTIFLAFKNVYRYELNQYVHQWKDNVSIQPKLFLMFKNVFSLELYLDCITNGKRRKFVNTRSSVKGL